jgi:hypothetical protein
MQAQFTMRIRGVAARRPDVYIKRDHRVEENKRQLKINQSSVLVNGIRVNFQGRFVGFGDIDRGLEYFNRRRAIRREDAA